MDLVRQHRRTEQGAVPLAQLLAVVGLLTLVVVALSSRSVASIELGFGSVGEHTAQARSDAGLGLLADLVLHAHDVQLSDQGRLEITDAEGRVSTVYLDQGVLRVARPGGALAELISDVEGVSFNIHRSRTLIDAEPLVEHGSLWKSEPPDGVSRAVLLESGKKLALGFTLQADAPDRLDSIAEIDEELVEALLGRLSLRAGRIDGHGLEFCHLRNEAAHVGAHVAGRGLLTIELFEARAPGDARPTGRRLSSLTVPMSELPEATYNWFDRSLGEEVIPPEVLDPRAGVKRLWWMRRPEVVLNVTPTLQPVEIDLAALKASVLPGHAYTLLIGTAGDDLLAVESVETASPTAGDVALKPGDEESWETQAFQVWHAVDGQLSFSRTTELLLPRRVDVSLQLGDELSLDETYPIDGVPASDRASTPRRAGLQLEGAGRVASIEQRVKALLDDASGVPVTRFSGRTLVRDTELEGLVVLAMNSVLYLDDVVLRGTIVSEPLSGGGSAPRIVVDGALRIASEGVLAGTAIYLPGGEIRTAAGFIPALQIEGDLIAREVDLRGRGALHGQIAAVESWQLGAGIEQPRIRRARRLRAPGLER